MTDPKTDELARILERVDELSVTEGVDSPEYEEAFAEYLKLSQEYGGEG